MPTKFNSVSNIFVSADGGMTFTKLGNVGEVELTSAEDDHLADVISYNLQSFEMDLKIPLKVMFDCMGITNNMRRFHGRKPMRWRKMR